MSVLKQLETAENSLQDTIRQCGPERIPIGVTVEQLERWLAAVGAAKQELGWRTSQKISIGKEIHQATPELAKDVARLGQVVEDLRRKLNEDQKKHLSTAQTSVARVREWRSFLAELCRELEDVSGGLRPPG